MKIDLLKEKIFQVNSTEAFNQLALQIFQHQYQHVPVYRNWVDLLNRPAPNHFTEIPFLPIAFFKSQLVLEKDKTAETTFLSSGTTQMTRSKHAVADLSLYETSFTQAFRYFFGNPEAYLVIALLPNYLQQGDSSLVYMVQQLIALTKHRLSDFYLEQPDRIEAAYHQGKKEGKKVILFGVSYALMDLADQGINLSDAIVVETGGMKGRRKEMDKQALHEYLKKGLGNPTISSEYGMTELLSQGYSMQDGVFQTPPWMKVILRQTNDPLNLNVPMGKTGGVNVIDLANMHSCSFIATDDLGKMHEEGFTLQGRFDQSDIRGCNLMVF